mgnify:CR=1 FL=1
MASDWDFMGPPEPASSFSFSDALSGFTRGVTETIGSVRTIQGALNGTGTAGANTRQDSAAPVAGKNNTLLYVGGVVLLFILLKKAG